MAAVAPIANPNTSQFYHGAAPRFKYVYYENAMTKGEVAQWTITAAKLGFGVHDAVDYSTRVAGVVPVTMAAAGWGWIQTKGFCDYIITDGGVAAPNADTVSTTSCFLVALAAAGGSGIPGATGVVAADVHDGNPVTGGHNSVFAMNLIIDSSASAGAIGACILCCWGG